MALLEGKVAVVTGAGSGIGREIALRFAREGARVVAADVSGAEQATADEAGETVSAINTDVSNEAQVKQMITHAVAVFGRLDVVANVAGIVRHAKLADLDMKDYDRVLDVDLRGVALTSKHAIPHFITGGGGSFINIASVAGLNGSDRGAGAYSAAKAGVISLTRTVACEYGQYNIRANAICPGRIETPMFQEAHKGLTEAEVASRSPLRPGRPDEIAAVAAFLASDEASYVSGVALPVDGGWTAKLA